MVFYSILESVFNITVTPLTVLAINKVISVFTLIVVFLIAKLVFKKNWIGLIILVSFTSSRLVQNNLSSLEHGTVSAFFVYASILFLFIFLRERDLTTFLLSNVCVVLASYYRYELSLMLGIPYIAYYSLFMYKNKKTKVYITITTLILIFISLSVLAYDFSVGVETPGNWRVSQGEDNPIIIFIKNSVNLLKNNILIQKELSLKSGLASLFTYGGFIVSLILIINIMYSLIKRKEVKSEYKKIYIFAFYYFLYFTFLLAFHRQGYTSSWLYGLNFLFCEFILTYFGISWLIKKIISKKFKIVINLLIFVTMVLFFIIALKSSHALSLEITPHTEQWVYDMKLLKENVDLDKSCKILKMNMYFQHLDFYYGLQENTIFIGGFYHPYEYIEEYDKTGKCFYYYDPYISEIDRKYSHIVDVDLKKLDESLISCKKTIEFESQLEDRPFALIKWSC